MRAVRVSIWLGVAVACVIWTGAFAAEVPAGAPGGGEVATGGPGDEQATNVRYALLDTDGLLLETLPQVYLFESKTDTLHSLIERIDAAGRDKSINGVVLRVGELRAGWSKVQDLRATLLRCRQAGKEVICVLEGGGNIGYYLASASDRIVMAPSAHLMVMGLRAEAIFAKTLLTKIGVEADFVQAGEFKSAGEPLTRDGPSPAFRESMESILDDCYDQLVRGIAAGRNMTPEEAAEAIGGGPYTDEGAVAAGLVDAVLFDDELVAELGKKAGGTAAVVRDYGETPAAAAVPTSPLALMRALMGAPAVRPAPQGPAIAVLYAVGPISVGDEEAPGIGEENVSARLLTRTIRRIAADATIQAVVLRVDSPGGSALASDMIWRELRLLDAKKPVIASFSDTAASGGYYIGAGARRIFAEPGTLTGSIGVFGGKIVLAQLFDNLGLNVVSFERGGPTTLQSSFAKFSEEDRRRITRLIGRTYETFLARVAETRPGMDVEAVRKVAAGRVWTGRQAMENGLVDALGDLDAAIAAAREAAGIAPDAPLRILRMPEPRSILDVVVQGMMPHAETGPLPGVLNRLPGGAGIRAYMEMLLTLDREHQACMMPAAITVR